jgi:hypothetical protein
MISENFVLRGLGHSNLSGIHNEKVALFKIFAGKIVTHSASYKKHDKRMENCRGEGSI